MDPTVGESTDRAEVRVEARAKLNVFLRVHYNGRCAVVLVNDRGPYGGGRTFDLSEAAADYLGYIRAGVVSVTADLLIPAG